VLYTPARRLAAATSLARASALRVCVQRTRSTRSPPRRPREESKDEDAPRNPIEARLLARERERQAKKPLTAKDLDNRMADAEERRQRELEAIKSKGEKFSRPAPGQASATRQDTTRHGESYGEEKDSHK